MNGTHEKHSRFVSAGMTRDCVDPWQYLEFRADGTVGPCCIRVIGDLTRSSLESIVNGEPVRRLRLDLLTGAPDAICQSCGLRGETPVNVFRDKIAALMRGLHLPEEFDSDLYLEANPDVKAAGSAAADHFLKYGRFEPRKLWPDDGFAR